MTLSRTLYVGCPLCGASEVKATLKADCSRHPLFLPGIPPEICWLQCGACEHVYTDGYHSKEALRHILGGVNEHQTIGVDIEKHRLVSARMVEKILPTVSKGFWCDIGFGNAALLLTAQEYGFVPVGIDLRRDNVEALKGLGVEAHCVDLAEFRQPSRFAVVSMCDVLEHMPYPAESLRLVHALLDDHGVLLVSMPNMDSIFWAIADTLDTNPYWGELEHYHNFGKQQLYRLLRNTGFEPIRYGISERYRFCMEVVAKKVR